MTRVRKKNGLFKRTLVLFAIGILISTVFLSLSYSNLLSNNVISTPNESVTTSGTVYSQIINLTEDASLDRVNEPVTFTLSSLNVGEAYHDSIRVNDNESTELISQVSNKITHANESWESSADWADPNWDYMREPTTCNLEVMPNYMGYEKVLHFTDDNNVNYIQCYEQNLGNQITGTVYTLVRTSQTNREVRLGLGDVGTFATLNFAETGHFEVYHTSSWRNLDTDTTYNANQWYLIAMEFNCTSDTMKVYIDGVLKSDDPFSSVATQLNTFGFTTYDKAIHVQTNVEAHVAWVDYSFASGYSAGRYNYLQSCNVSFLANVSANTQQNFTLYSNSESQGDPGYTDMTTGTDSGFPYCEDMNGGIWRLHNLASDQFTGRVYSPTGSAQDCLSAGLFFRVPRNDPVLPEFNEIGPVFCMGVSPQTGGHGITQVFNNGWDRISFKDDSIQTCGTHNYNDWATPDIYVDEIQIPYSSGSWEIADPPNYEPFSGSWALGFQTNAWDGYYFSNVDSDDWILVFAADLTQDSDMDCIYQLKQDHYAYTEVGYYETGRVPGDAWLNNGHLLDADTDYEFWRAMIKSTANNDATQQSDAEDLHTMMISNPLLVNSIITNINYKEQVTYNENAGLDRTNEPVTYTLENLDAGDAYYDSVRVYDGETEIVSQVWKGVYDTFDTDHNFESATDWGDPSGWTIIEGTGSDVRVLPYYMGHSKVCELLDEGSGAMQYGEIREDFTNQDNGTIEFWIQNSDASKGLSFQASPSGSTTMRFALRLWEDKIQYYDGSFQDTGETAQDNTWYHVKITFESTTGLYDGLAQNKWRAYVTPENGSTIQLGDYDFGNSGSVGRVHFHCNGPHTGYSGYVDAVDYSWESGYFEGRNKYLKSCDVSFLANVSANSNKVYNINYSSTSLGDPGYTDMITGNDGTNDYIEDRNTARWYLNPSATNEAMDGVRGPGGSFYLTGHGTDAGLLQLSGDNPSVTQFMDEGPIFCQAYRTQTGGYMITEVFDVGATKMRIKDDATYNVGVWGLRNGVGVDEHHYKESSSWGMRDNVTTGADPSWTYNLVATSNYDGMSFFNNDGESWIMATLINSTITGANQFSIHAATGSGGSHYFCMGFTGSSQYFTANQEVEYWYVSMNSTADNDAQQRNDTEDLYTQLIIDPLSPTIGGVSDTSIETPENIQATPSGWTNNNSFNITWNNPSDESGIIGAYYKLYSAPTSDTDGTYTAGADIEQLIDISVISFGNHSIYVWLEDGVNNIDYTKNNQTFLLLDTIIDAPQSLTAVPAGWTNGTISVTWTNVPDTSGIVGAYYKLDSAPTYATDGTYMAGANIQQINDINVVNEGTHDIYVWLRDAASNVNHVSRSTVMVYNDSTILAPIGITATPSGRTATNSFNLSWTNPTDASGIVGAFYKLGAAPTYNVNGIYVAGANIQSITGITVPSNGTHNVHVWLNDSAGNTYYLNHSTTTLNLDIIPPVYPTINPPSVSQDSVTLSWALVTNGSVVKYNIYRSSSPMASVYGLTPIAFVDGQTNSYTDRGLEDGSYYYVITSVDDLGQESLVSNNIGIRIMHKFNIIMIIIIVIGVVGGIGASSGVIVYKRRSASPSKPKEGKKGKITKQLDPDILEAYKRKYTNKSYTLPKIAQEKVMGAEFLEVGKFSDKEKMEISAEIYSLPEVERNALLSRLKNLKSEEELLRFLDGSLQNVEIFEKKSMLDHLKEEYYKILILAEQLGNINLFERIEKKLIDLEISMESNNQ